MNVLDTISAVASGGISDLQNPALWVLNALGIRKSSAGVNVTPESALALSTYFACIRNVSEDISGLPFKAYKRLKPNGKEEAPGRPLWNLIHDEANSEMCSQVFWETLIHWAMGWGNGYAEIERNGAGIAIALHHIHPSRVMAKRDRDTQVLFYDVQNDNGQIVRLRPDEIFHLRGIGDDLEGYSIARIGSESIGRAMATQEFSAKFYGDSTLASGAFTTPQKLSDKAFENLRRTWPKGLPSAHNPLFLEGDMKWQPFTVSPEEAQMLETGKDGAVDVARWFRMPLHKVGILDKATFSNIAHQAIEYVGDTLRPWARRIESETRSKLMPLADRKMFVAKFDFRALLRGDVVAQTTHYTSMFNIGAYSINEIRGFEDLNPIEGGNEHMVPLNMSPASGTEKTDNPEPPDRENDDRPQRRNEQVTAFKKAHARLFADATQRLATKEAHALSRAAKKYTADDKFFEWAEVFYAEHIKQSNDSLLPVALSLAETICMACGVAPLTAAVADAVTVAVQGWTARQYPTAIGQVEQMLDTLDGESARVAGIMPDRIESVVCEVLEMNDGNNHEGSF